MSASVAGRKVLQAAGLVVILLGAADSRSQPAPSVAPANGVPVLPPSGAGREQVPEKLPTPKVVPLGEPYVNPLAAWSPEASLALPTPQELFRVESETQFRERLRADYLKQKVPIEFPSQAGPPVRPNRPPHPGRRGPRPSSPRSSVTGRSTSRTGTRTRCGWRVPLVQPLVSTGKFYLDALLLPYSMAAMPPCSWECNSGSPLPATRCRTSTIRRPPVRGRNRSSILLLQPRRGGSE